MTADISSTHQNMYRRQLIDTTADTFSTGKFLNICNIYNINIYKNKKYKKSNYSYILYLSVIYLLKDYRQIYKNNKYYTDRFRQKGGTR
jgi:hypothetical protein